MTPEEVYSLRMHLLLSRERFARRLGVAAQTIYRWENGLNSPNEIDEERLRRLKAEVGG